MCELGVTPAPEDDETLKQKAIKDFRQGAQPLDVLVCMICVEEGRGFGKAIQIVDQAMEEIRVAADKKFKRAN